MKKAIKKLLAPMVQELVKEEMRLTAEACIGSVNKALSLANQSTTPNGSCQSGKNTLDN